MKKSIEWCVAMVLSTCALFASAQNYPAGQMRIVAPFPPGGGADIMGREIGQKLTEAWGVPVVVDNRVGANGTLGAAFVAKSPPDGLTLLVIPAGYASNPVLYSKLSYDQEKELQPVSHLASGPLVMVTHPALPAKDLRSFIALAKAKPGTINFGTPGIGALPHLSAELFSNMAGIQMVRVPYKGPGAAIVDLISGQIQVYFINILQSLPFIREGKLRGLGVTSAQRSPIAPNMPAIAEAGLPGYDMTNWYGMLAPAGTPHASVDKLSREVARILNLPELKERLAKDGMTVVASTPEQFRIFLAKETEKYAKVIKMAGIKLQ